MQDGATAILLAGNMCDARLWTPEVRAALPVTAIDANLTSDTTIAGMATRALGLAGAPLILVGFSMGGIVALEMARQAPDRICGMILADTNAAADLPNRAAARPEQQACVRAGHLATVVANELKPNYLAAANRADAGLKDLLLDMAMSLGPDVFCRQSEALRTRADNSPVLDAFAAPVLLLAGAEDALCPPAWHAAMAAQLARATLRIVDGAGHMLPLERPDQFAAAVSTWFVDNNFPRRTAARLEPTR